MKRIQSFEFHELQRAPGVLRQTIVETLGHGMNWTGFYEAVAPTFAEFCELAGCREVLDLCSGSGRPAAGLLDAMVARGLDAPRFTLTDLFPHVASLRAVARRHPGHIALVAEPVDATAVPAALDAPARVIINAFHHFPPHLAARIVADAVHARRALFVLEPFPRSIWRFAATLPGLSLAMLAIPLTTGERRLGKTLALPASALCGLWDGVVSALRQHNRAELSAMAAASGAESYDWEYREIPFPLGGLAVVFFGVPTPSSKAA